LGRHYREQNWGQNRLDKSGFTRRLHALTDTLLALFATCAQLLKDLHTEDRYVSDSFPGAVCQNSRIPRCKLLTGQAYHGRSASKRQWFYGLKVQVISTIEGVYVEVYIHAGSEADITGLRAMALDLPDGSLLYTDNAYTDYALEDLFAEATGGQQFTACKANSKSLHSPAQRFLVQHFRKAVETTFSQLTARFPKHIHAVTAAALRSSWPCSASCTPSTKPAASPQLGLYSTTTENLLQLAARTSAQVQYFLGSMSA
jgi:hypothetical protein